MADRRRWAKIGYNWGRLDKSTDPADGDLLVYNATDLEWKHVSGSGSSIDADTVDGIDSTSFLRSDTADTAAGVITYTASPVLASDVDINFTNTDDVIVGLLDFTGGAAGEAQWAEVQLIADFDGADAATSFTEESQNAAVATFAGTAQLDTAQFKFGTASLLLDGNSDYVTFPDIAGYTLGASDWTIEGWVRFSALPSASGSNGHTLYAHWNNTGNQRSLVIKFTTGNQLRIVYSTTGSTSTGREATDTPSLSIDTWYHVAVCRSGSTLYAFVNGTQLTLDSSTISGTLHDSTDSLRIGATNTTAGSESFMAGWIDDLRVQVGTANYTTGFSPPTTAWPTTQQSDNRFEVGDTSYATRVTGSSVSVPTSFLIYDTGITDYASFAHDGTDFNTTFVNTGAWNVTMSGGNPFNVKGVLQVENAAPLFTLYETGVTADNAKWFYFVNAEVLKIAAATDAGLAGTALVAFERTNENIDQMELQGGMDLWLRDAGFLRIYDSTDTDYAQFSHDGTNFQTTFVNTATWNIDGSTNIIISPPVYLDGDYFELNGASPSFIIKETGVATDSGIWEWRVDSSVLNLYLDTDAYSANTNVINISRTGTTLNYIYLHGTEVGVRGGSLFRVFDSANTDYVSFSHDGTNFTLDGTNTQHLDITSLTGDVRIRDGSRLILFDSLDTDSLIINQSSTAALLISTQHIVFTPAASHQVYVFDSGQNAPFRIYDGGGTDYFQMYHNGTDAYFTAVNTSWYRFNDAGVLLIGGKELRVYDSTSADYITLYHNGTDAFIDVDASSNGLQIRHTTTARIAIDSNGIGFFAATPVAKPTVTGSRGGNAALASALTALANLGLITDSSTA